MPYTAHIRLSSTSSRLVAFNAADRAAAFDRALRLAARLDATLDHVSMRGSVMRLRADTRVNAPVPFRVV